MEVPKLNVIRGAVAPQVTRPKGHHPLVALGGNSMFTVSPANPVAEAIRDKVLTGTLPHNFYKEVSYLDGDGIDDYTLISDNAGMFKGMEGTRVPRADTRGGFIVRENDPKGALYEYGTEDEKWLEESENGI